MTGRKEWLADFDESKKSKVKLADNSSLQAEGTGNIVFQMYVVHLKNIQLVETNILFPLSTSLVESYGSM